MTRRRSASSVALACLCLTTACSNERGGSGDRAPAPTAASLPTAVESIGQTSSTRTEPGPSGGPVPPKVPSITVTSLEPRVAPLMKAVDPDRAFGDITTLSRSPRHPRDNPTETRAAAAYIARELTAAGLQPREIAVESDGVTLPVVWAEIRGRRCVDKVFVLTGHYDTVRDSPGADDDASGIAGMLETARVLARSEPDATIVVAGLPFEEQGPPYPASRTLAEHLKKQGRTIIGMLSAEMLGYASATPEGDDPGNTLLLLGYEGAEGLVGTFRAAATTWTTTGSQWAGVEAGTYPASTSFISRSDHAAFHDLGVPAAFATDGANFRTPHYHQRSDTAENIVRPFFAGAVRTLVTGTFAMASLDSDGDGSAEACAGRQPG